MRTKGAFYNMKTTNQNAAAWIYLLLDMLIVTKPSFQPVGGRPLEAVLGSCP